MKKTLFTFLLLFAATAMNAQGIVKGDMDGDGEVTITDVMSAVDVILGKAPKQLVKPYNVDNTLIVGTWYAPDGTSFTLYEDGTIEDYTGAAKYKFRNYLGTLTMYNVPGKAVKVMGVVKVEKSYLLLLDYASGAVAYYTSSAVPNFHNPDDYVDLGLPSGTLWATCNVGASSPEDYGDYFAWGETSAKTSYNSDWSNYFDTNDDGNTFNKYYDNGGLTELKPEDDAAYVNWGPAWRMPSEEQFEELVNSSYTITEWTTQNGVNGRKITSRANGNSIFLPASGYRGVSSLIAAGSDGMVWSRTLITSSSISAVTLGFSSGGIGPGFSRRSGGHCVRPVRSEISVEVSSPSLYFASLGGSKQVSINCNGSWTASSSESWCAVSPASGTGNGSLTITVSENISTDSRSATVTVTAGALTRTITVMQYGKVTDHTPAGVTAVDLGLPSGTLWANMNVGASSPEDYGDYFAWGETEPYAENGKTTFDWSTYKWCNGSDNTMTKYCSSRSYGNNGFSDDNTELDPGDDAAYVNWGPAWRMPSLEQFDELMNSSYTITEWTTQNGVKGRLITSNSNGNSIFLPVAGNRDNSSLGHVDFSGFYWSRTLYSGSPNCAWNLYFSQSQDLMRSKAGRYNGFSVRPVRFSEISVEVSSSSLSFVSLGGSEQVSINCNGSWTASSSESWCAVSPASGTGDGSLTITVSENTSTDSRSATVTVTADALTRTITVTQNGKAAGNTPAGVTAVDLGLPSGTLWANMNVGASSPEDYGDYFAWGETEPYAENGKTTFDWSTYFDTNDNGSTFNKYNNNGGLTELKPEDDAAYVNWGPAWRMPSQEQFEELINSNYTTTEWTTQNGVNGRLITSNSNGNSVFLPAAGARPGSFLFDAGSGGDYWSRTLNSEYPDRAWGLYFHSSSVYTDYGFRYYGFTVRPVRRLPE